MKRLFAALAAVVTAAAIAYGASIPLLTGPQDPSQLNATINGVINSINSGITSTTIGAFNSNSRNILDNGDLGISIRGTSAVTCAVNAGIASVNYGADRWGCQANVAVGAGRQQVITATPTPPPGFTNAMTLFRTSGALTQPICTWQAIPTADVTKLAGQQVLFSAYLQALAGMAADNGAIANLVIITGTGTDETLGTAPTASPAITPAWTGIATLVNTATTALSSTTWNRYTATGVVATTVKEMAVGLCFTPTATGSGATDGFAWTGALLEVVGAGVTVPSTFPFKSIAYETRQAQRYAWTLVEPASNVCQGAGYSSTTTAARIVIANPVTMRAAPTVSSIGATLAGTTWQVQDAATPIVLSTPFLATFTANTTTNITLTATTGASQTAGRGVLLCGAGGGGILIASADL